MGATPESHKLFLKDEFMEDSLLDAFAEQIEAQVPETLEPEEIQAMIADFINRLFSLFSSRLLDKDPTFQKVSHDDLNMRLLLVKFYYSQLILEKINPNGNEQDLMFFVEAFKGILNEIFACSFIDYDFNQARFKSTNSMTLPENTLRLLDLIQMVLFSEGGVNTNLPSNATFLGRNFLSVGPLFFPAAYSNEEPNLDTSFNLQQWQSDCKPLSTFFNQAATDAKNNRVKSRAELRSKQKRKVAMFCASFALAVICGAVAPELIFMGAGALGVLMGLSALAGLLGVIITTYQTGVLHYKRKALADQTSVEKLDSNLKKLQACAPRVLGPSA